MPSALNDADYISHKGMKDTKGFMGIRDSLGSLCGAKLENKQSMPFKAECIARFKKSAT